MAFADSHTTRPGFGLHSRVALAIAHATVDSQIQEDVIPYGSAIQTKALVDYVQELLNGAPTEWNDLLNDKFPPALAKATNPLNGFRHYMIQDATYLEYYYRVRMEAVGKSGTFEQVQEIAAKLSSGLDYVKSARSDCTKKLGVPESIVRTEPKSQELQNSIKLYEDVVKTGNWLDIYIALLPCILGYYTIADKLLKDSSTVRNTIYFPMWILGNSSGSSAAKYTKFINDNITPQAWEQKKTYWIGLFKNACKHESAFFRLGDSKNSIYAIVDNATYKIQSYRNKAYLVSDGTLVTTQADNPGDNGLWILTNTANGYTIQNKQHTKFLNVTVTPPTKVSYSVDLVGDQNKKPWSINVAEVQGYHQLLVPAGLQFVLDGGNDPSDARVFAANNSLISSQIWQLVRA